MAHGVRLPALALLGLALLGLPTALHAQAGFNTFQFSFSNPGARSMGFGGAFVALADDATAAFANPAGLVQILEPEISIEGRSWIYSTPYTVGGRLNGEPSGFGLDTMAGLRFGASEQEVAGVSFLSFVYPKNRWSFAAYRHQLSSFEFRGETQGFFAIPFGGDPGFRREGDRRTATTYDVVGYGLTGAWQVTDTLSVGLGWVYFDIGLTGTEERFSFDIENAFFEPNPYSPVYNYENILFNVDDSDVGLSAGFLWSPTAHWRLGGTYRQGPESNAFSIELLSGRADPSLPVGTRKLGITSPLAFPDVFGLGVAYRAPGDSLTLSFEWDRVEYSTILESLTFDNQTTISDGDEFHVGVEFVFLERRPVIALRGGAWLDPDHRLRFEDDAPVLEEILDQALFRRGDDEIHLSAGVGLVFRRFQIDLGVDVSDLVDAVSMSTIYSF